jgi:hypothetical protein
MYSYGNVADGGLDMSVALLNAQNIPLFEPSVTFILLFALLQDLELWISREVVTDGYNLVARAGRVVQEIHVETDKTLEEMKTIVGEVLKRVM